MAPSLLNSVAMAVTITMVTLLPMMAHAATVPPNSPESSDFNKEREELIAKEKTMGIEGHAKVELTDDEEIVNSVMMEEKARLIEASRTGDAPFAPAINFMTSCPAMESTTAFKIIQKMPKGGILHVHKSALTSLDWVISNITYRPHLYMCVGRDTFVMFKFSNTAPTDADCAWKNVADHREGLSEMEIQQFDKSLRENISLVSPNPEIDYPDLATVWDKFEMFFNVMGSLISHTPVFRDYLRQAFTELYADGVTYVEIRGSLPKLYELDGEEHSREWAINNVYKPAIDEFKSQHTHFTGAKLILTTFRGKSPSSIGEFVKDSLDLYQRYPEIVVGADLVGQEDPNHSLKDLQDQLLYPSRLQPPAHLPYFFHAGETDWLDTATDRNLMDALLLNASRIGHGFALHNHPLLMGIVKDRGIAIEVSPISNQVLMLVEDLRDHPATIYIAENIPVVISSDDPATWDALPLSHDFYVTFMALAGKDDGLMTLKQLALNSLRYSAMTETEKEVAIGQWTELWDQFIGEEAARLNSSS